MNLVFIHEIDPSHSDDPKVQGALQAVHDGVDVNELRDKLEKLEKLEKQVNSVETLAKKAISRPSGGQSSGRQMMC